MVMDNIKSLVLEDETFEEPRQNFNRVLQRLFKSMIDSGSTDGSITLKIDVSLAQEYIPNYDPDVEGESRKISKPAFKHKVTSTVTVRDEVSGNKNPQMELVWDEEKQMYVLAYICNTDQRTIFDKDASWNQGEESGEGALETDPGKPWMNIPQLPGEVADEGALPGEVADPDGEVIDGDFKEVGDGENGQDEPEDGENTEDESQTSPNGDNEANDDDYGYEEPEE